MAQIDDLPPPPTKASIDDLPPPPPPQGHPVQAFTQGMGNSASLGYLPELQALGGAATNLLPNASEEASQKLRAQGFHIQEPSTQAGVTLDEARQRQINLKEENPKSYLGGEVTGLVTSAPMYGAALKGAGLGGEVEAKGLLQGFGQGAIQGAKGGAALGLLSNPNTQVGQGTGLNPEQRITNMGEGAALGGLLGGVGGAAVSRYGKIVPESGTPTEPPPPAPEMRTNASTGPTQSPNDLGEMTKQVSQFKEKGGSTELPSAGRLREVVQNNADLPKPLPNFHEKMLGSKADYEELRTLAESPNEVGKSIREYEQMMKVSAQNKLQKTVESVAERPPLDKMEAGEQLLQDVSQKYHDTKDQLGPVFQQFRDLSLPKAKIVPEVRENLVKDIPKLKSSLTVNEETGNLELKPFSTKMGISEQSYGVMSKVVRDLNSKSLSFEDLQNMREYMRQSQDPTNPKATQILSDARKSLLNYMTNLVGDQTVNLKNSLNVRETFKQYAVNEKSLEQVEKIIGGKVENMDQLITAAPERVMDRIFSNTNNIQVMKQIMGEDRVRQMAADYVHNLIQRSSPNGNFSSARLASALNKQQYALKEALPPEVYKRIVDLTDYMRMVPDASSPNPSGTARVSAILSKLGTGSVGGAAKEGLGLIHDIGSNVRAKSKFNEMLSPRQTPTRRGNIFTGGK